MASTRTEEPARRHAVPAALVGTLTGVATAYGLSASGIVIGALVARWLDTRDFIPDGYAPWGWAALAAVGTVAAGATVADVAGRWARRSIVLAGILAGLGTWQIMGSVETTGAEGVELPIVVAVGAAFGGLLGLGAVIHRRRTAARKTS